ncbi:MAG: hypothetical protein HC905_20445 [Bacteroidales bacterium]|nr:hypothetical protein [Bacteroidales bacterium]
MKETILRLITGQISRKEENEMFNFVDQTPENKEEYARYLNLWALSSQKGQYERADQRDIDKFQQQIQKQKRNQVFKKVLRCFF